jgi:hypothetical protein
VFPHGRIDGFRGTRSACASRLLALQLLADPRLRARLREQWVAERSSGDRLALVKLALRARLGDANTPLPTDSHDQEATS